MKQVFYFDTAKLSFIDATWKRLTDGGLNPQLFGGITTNPNAFAKINCMGLNQMRGFAADLLQWLNGVADNYNLDHLVLHVQAPNSRISLSNLIKFVQVFSTPYMSKVEVAYKISPDPTILKYLTTVIDNSRGRLPRFNVTGIADAATAIRCALHPDVTWASIIPGRMEEQGINAQNHLECAVESISHLENKAIIAGSMRTLPGLYRSIGAGCHPTIGERVWNDLSDVHEFNESFNETRQQYDYWGQIPYVDDRNVKLTYDFFEQMDTLGVQTHTDLINRP